MANFEMHISTSCAVGAVLGGIGYAVGMPTATCVVAGTLCGIAGMLPDLDHDGGVPLRETLSFMAAAVACLMQERWRHLGLTLESLAMAGLLTYIMIRFALGGMLRRLTVHRGMFHSLPAALIAGLLTFLVCHSTDMNGRLFKSGAVVLGFLVHLILDEIYSFEYKNGLVRIKNSFGTAMKIYGDDPIANLVTFAQLVGLTYVAVHDPFVMDRYRQAREQRMVGTGEPAHQAAPGNALGGLRPFALQQPPATQQVPPAYQPAPATNPPVPVARDPKQETRPALWR